MSVVDHGSMAAAARALNLSSSAVAQQLKALERDIDAPLLIRIGRTVRLTEQGGRILVRARQLLRDAIDLRSVAHDGSVRGELRLGACSTALIGLVPQILARLTAKYRDVTVHVESSRSTHLYTLLESGEIDAAFVLEAPYLLPKTCDWLLLREEPLIVLAPQSLAARDAHDLLRTEPFIRYSRSHWGGNGADEYLKEFDIVPNERIEVDLLQSIAVMVSRGMGVSLVPDWALPWPEGLQVARLALPQARIGRRLGIVSSRSSVRGRLINVLLDESRAMIAEGHA